MKIINSSLWIAICCYLLMGCNSEILDSTKLLMDENEKNEILISDQIVMQDVERLYDYVKIVDNRWFLDISLEQAIHIGIVEKNYNDFLSSMRKANESIEEAEQDSCFVRLNLPQAMKINSVVRMKTRMGESGGDVGTALATMSPNSQVGFSSSTVRVRSHVHVQSMFFWTFRIKDETWNEDWGESGGGPANLDHNWTCKLGGAPYSFQFSNVCSDTDGTGISFSFFTTK